MTYADVIPGSILDAAQDDESPEAAVPAVASRGRPRRRASSSSARSRAPSPIKVEALDREYRSVDDLQHEVEDLENVCTTSKGLMKFDNDDIESDYVAIIVTPTLRTRIIPITVAFFAYSLYSIELSKWFNSTAPDVSAQRQHTAAETLFNLSWIYHILSSIAMFTLCIVPTANLCKPYFEVVTQIWLNIGIWVGVLFGNRWRNTEIFGDDPIAPVYDENNDEGGAPVQYPSDADLLLLLNGIITYLCIWTPCRTRLLIPLALTICLSYGGTSLILGGPNDENSLPHSLMLVILVTMVMSGKMNLEKNVRQQFVAFNISVRKTKLLEHTVRELNNPSPGPTTNYEKAFADIESALTLLEGFGGSQPVGMVGGGGGGGGGAIVRDTSSDNESNFQTRVAEYRLQIVGATSLIRDSVTILSRRTRIDKVVLDDEASSAASTRQETRREFVEYINHLLNQDSTPNQLDKEWTLMTGGKVTLNATSSYMGDIPAKAYAMLEAVGQDFNLNLIELQETHLPNIPILPLIGSQLASVLAFGALRIEWDIFRNFLTRISGTYTEVEYHNQAHAAQVTSHGNYLLRATGMPVSALDYTAFLVACICHDVGHSGKNNGFYVETGDRLALRYNDRSVLEQFHVATAFEMMEDFHECNIIENLTREERKGFRSFVIELILATDMAKHFAALTDLRLLVRNSEFRTVIQDPMNADERLLIFKACIKAADIGHTCLPWDQHYELSLRLAEEFFKQGDLEKQLHVPVSPLCDRDRVNLPRSQLGFIDYLVRPFIDIMTKIDLDHRTDMIMKQLDTNVDGWKSQEDEGKTRPPLGWSYKPIFKKTTDGNHSGTIAKQRRSGNRSSLSSHPPPPPPSDK